MPVDVRVRRLSPQENANDCQDLARLCAIYRSGKEKAFGFLVGQVMRQLRGQAAPAVVRQVLLEQLAEQ